MSQKKSEMDEWDGDDNTLYANKKVNKYDQKEMRRELLNLLRNYNKEITGPEAQELFKKEFDEEFEYKNFGCRDMENFLSRMRELECTNKDEPNVPKRFQIVKEHKYVLFAEQAVGGKSVPKVEDSAQEQENRHSQRKKKHHNNGSKESVPFEGYGSTNHHLENPRNNANMDHINNKMVPENAINASNNNYQNQENGVYSDSDDEVFEAPGVPQCFVNRMVAVNNNGGRRPMTGAGDAPSENQSNPTEVMPTRRLDEEELQDFLPAAQIPSFQTLAKSNCEVLMWLGKIPAGEDTEDNANMQLAPPTVDGPASLKASVKEDVPKVTKSPVGENTENKTNHHHRPTKPFNKPQGNRHKGKPKGGDQFHVDEMRTLVMEHFPSVGVRKRADFFSAKVRVVFDRNPDVFEKTKDQGVDMVTLKKSVTELCAKGNHSMRNATIADLLWILKGKCVVHEEEDLIDTCEIIYFAKPDLIVCGSFFGCVNAERLTEIGGLLKVLVDSDALTKPKGFAPGNMYIAPLSGSFARVIIVGMAGQNFTAIAVDRPYVTHVSPGELWEVPDEWKLSAVPGNVYLARLRGCKDVDFNKVSQQSKKEIKMVFTGRDENGIRFADFILYNYWFTQTLSGGYRETMSIQQAKAAYEIRKVSNYFIYSGKYTDVMESYNSRPAAPNVFGNIDQLMNVMNSMKTPAEMSVLAKQMQNYLDGIMPHVRVVPEDVIEAYRLFQKLGDAAQVPTTETKN